MTTDELVTLIKGKKGSLTKISVSDMSAIPVGMNEYGYFDIIEHEKGPQLICESRSSWLRTSPVKEVTRDGNNILVTTQTSVYKIVLTDEYTVVLKDENDISKT